MDVANECMADVANAQLMAMACTLKRKQYFQARTTAIALAEANKLKKLELQKLELDIQEEEKSSAGTRIQSSGWRRSSKCT
jgi:hypothetical protein